MEKQLQITFEEWPGREALPTDDRQLLDAAEQAAHGAYAPYSHFHVGAAIRLAEGTIVTGNNQENAAYPSGLCAERTALFAASANHPGNRDMTAIAIIGINHQGQLCQASPCGSCRQAMAEYENLQPHPIRVICYVNDHCIRCFHSVASLLPFAFDLQSD